MSREERTSHQVTSLEEIEQIISKAIKKVHGRKENDLCKFLPMSSGGYMHHFTLRKMKNRQPHELGFLIEKFIINADKPAAVAPKQRASRGSRKRRDHFQLSKPLVDKILNIARLAGDKEVVEALAPKKSFTTCKKELLAAIRQNRIEPELWNAYVEALTRSSSPLFPPVGESNGGTSLHAR